MADRTLYLVFTNPTEGRDSEFDEWYSAVHVPDVLSIPGVVSAQRYSLRDDGPGAGGAGATHKYLTVYELDDEPSAVMAKMHEAVGSGRMQLSDSMDLATITMSYWIPRGPRVEA